MSHRNAPLTPEGRRRLVARCRYRPIAHVAAEAGVSRQCLGKWVARWRAGGEKALRDASSRPHRCPTATPDDVVTRVLGYRRRKWSAARIAAELTAQGRPVSVSTVARILTRHGLNQLRHLDVDGRPLRHAGVITAAYRGHMVHVDIKKIGRIPDGGGWRTTGRGSDLDRAVSRAKTAGARAGYVYLHSAVDGYTRLAYTEPLDDEKGPTAAGFLRRAAGFFAAHGISRITRVVTDNGSCYRSRPFADAVTAVATRQQRIRPYTPRHNGKVERYQQTLAREVLYARPFSNEQARTDAIATWLIHYNYHRPHTATGGLPPASRTHAGVTNVMTDYI